MSEKMTEKMFEGWVADIRRVADFYGFGTPRALIGEARRARAREEELERENAEAKAEIARLREALTCPGDNIYGGVHRCVRCDSEVG